MCDIAQLHEAVERTSGGSRSAQWAMIGGELETDRAAWESGVGSREGEVAK